MLSWLRDERAGELLDCSGIVVPARRSGILDAIEARQSPGAAASRLRTSSVVGSVRRWRRRSREKPRGCIIPLYRVVGLGDATGRALE